MKSEKNKISDVQVGDIIKFFLSDDSATDSDKGYITAFVTKSTFVPKIGRSADGSEDYYKLDMIIFEDTDINEYDRLDKGSFYDWYFNIDEEVLVLS